MIYDVLGDVVCGGFAMPIRAGIADHVFTVSSADFMSVYAANNLFKGIEKYSRTGGALLGGIIANSVNEDYQRDILQDFAAKTETQIISFIPRSVEVTQSELQGKTTIEALPNSAQAAVYRSLAEKIVAHCESKTPKSLTQEELRNWSAHWGQVLLAQK